jgi:Putative peptidoglycan binding domain
MGLLNRLFGSDESKIKETLEELESGSGNIEQLDNQIKNAYMSNKSRDEILAAFSEDMKGNTHFTAEHFAKRVDAQLGTTALDKLDALIDTGTNQEALIKVAKDINTLDLHVSGERLEKLQKALGADKVAELGLSGSVDNADNAITEKLSQIATLEASLANVGGGHQGNSEKSAITKDVNEQKSDIAEIYKANAGELSDTTIAALNKVGLTDEKIAGILKNDGTADADKGGVSNPLIQPVTAAEAPVPAANEASAPQTENTEKVPVTKISFQPHERGTGVGYTGEPLKEVQQFLAERGYFANADALEKDVDGDFGGRTRDAVKKFQASNSITADGIIGKDTIAAMNAVLAKEQAAEAAKGTQATPTPEGAGEAPTQGNNKEQQQKRAV